MRLSTDTIFAAASGQGRAAVHVIRISGPASRAILETLAAPLPPPRRLSLRVLRRPESPDILDEALVAWMPGPGSFTGEDQAELHIHGGLATRAAVLRALADCRGCRPAEPGEFTRRAFLNGRMDLTRVEGLADLIDAETEAQRRQALRQLGGELGSAAEAWREALLQGLALLEASLDFTDESDVPEGLEREVASGFREIQAQIGAVVARGSGERLRDGLTVVLAGPPNAGKSTLLNALARRDVAIVSPVPGTTRDAIEVRCDLGGWPVTFVDTAGLRESTDPVERIGMERARARAAEADLVLWLVPPDGAGEPPHGQVLTVATKADLGGSAAAELQVSAATGTGMAELLAKVQQAAEHSFAGGEALLTRERHRLALERAHEALSRSVALIESGSGLELATEDARLAVRAIGQITGRVDVEDVLDRLFAGFCIGK